MGIASCADVNESDWLAITARHPFRVGAVKNVGEGSVEGIIAARRAGCRYSRLRFLRTHRLHRWSKSLAIRSSSAARSTRSETARGAAVSLDLRWQRAAASA